MGFRLGMFIPVETYASLRATAVPAKPLTVVKNEAVKHLKITSPIITDRWPKRLEMSDEAIKIVNSLPIIIIGDDF